MNACASSTRVPLLLLAAVAAATVGGCALTDPLLSRAQVSAELRQRVGHDLGPAERGALAYLPAGVHWDNGLTEDEATVIALWNNAAYQELLAELGLAQADVIQAGLLANPDFVILFPVGVKQLEWTLAVPVEALWLRPKRLAAAELEAERAGERMVQGGLDLVRDVRWALAELQLARDRVRLAKEAVELRLGISKIAEARVKAGDASKLEIATAQIDVLRAREEAARLAHDVTLAEERLRTLIGLGRWRDDLRVQVEAVPAALAVSQEELVNEALASRPDLRAAVTAVRAAAEKARLARCDFLSFAVLADANGKGEKGFEAGPGLRFTVPLFNWNQGGIARAEAQWERAERQLATVRDRAALEVREAFVRLCQAEEDLRTWQKDIRPVVEDALARAEKAYKQGEASQLLVLETTRHLLEARLREVQLQAEVRRARAELERSVGRRLTSPDPGGPILEWPKEGPTP